MKENAFEKVVTVSSESLPGKPSKKIRAAAVWTGVVALVDYEPGTSLTNLLWQSDWKSKVSAAIGPIDGKRIFVNSLSSPDGYQEYFPETDRFGPVDAAVAKDLP